MALFTFICISLHLDVAPSPADFTAQERSPSGPGRTCPAGLRCTAPLPAPGPSWKLDCHPHLKCPFLFPWYPGRLHVPIPRSLSLSLRALSCAPPGLARRPVCSQDSPALTMHSSFRSASVPPAGRAGQRQGPQWVGAPRCRAHLCPGDWGGGQEPTPARKASRAVEASYPSPAPLPGPAASGAAGRRL